MFTKLRTFFILLRRIRFELRLYRGLNFEALKGDRKGEYSIRINDQYRIIFEQIETIQHRVIIKVLFINEISKHYE